MQYLKFGKLAALTAFSLSLAACAELTNGLQAVNTTLAGINSGTDSSGTTPNTIAMPDKVTSQYEVRNLRLTQETVSDLKVRPITKRRRIFVFLSKFLFMIRRDITEVMYVLNLPFRQMRE